LVFIGKKHSDKPGHQHGHIKLSHKPLEKGDRTGQQLTGYEIAVAYCGEDNKAVRPEPKFYMMKNKEAHFFLLSALSDPPPFANCHR
jgi:hypothetical protein